MRKAPTGVARRYARALLEVALEAGSAEAMRGELEQAVALLGEHKQLASALASPAVPLERKREIVDGVWGGGAVSLLNRLLALLVERGRIALLPSIEQVYGALWNAQRKVVAAEAVSAVPLDPAQRKALSEAIGKATGMGVELTEGVEPALLGGLLVRMGGRVYDGSVRAQLQALRQRLSGATH